MRFTQPVSTLRRVPRQVAGGGSTRVCGAQAVTAAAAADCRELTGHQAQAQELHLQTQPLCRRCGLSTPQLGDARCRPPQWPQPTRFRPSAAGLAGDQLSVRSHPRLWARLLPPPEGDVTQAARTMKHRADLHQLAQSRESCSQPWAHARDGVFFCKSWVFGPD